MALSEAAVKALKLAGWEPGRRTDVKSYERILRAEGYPTPKLMMDFLSEFGGLRVSVPHPKIPGALDKFHFDVSRAVGGITTEKVGEYAERVGGPLSVIGEASRGHEVLMMDGAGRVFAGYDDILLEVGQSGEDAIDSLSEGRLKTRV